MNALDRPAVALWHPFTSRAVGWSPESDLPEHHSAPHVAALARIAADRGATAEVHYLTDRHRAWTRTGELTWRFWPRSRRWIRGSKRFRHEWSGRALTHERRQGASTTIINTSGLGGTLARALAAVVTETNRPYVAMIGGTNVGLGRPQAAYYRAAAAIAVHNEIAAESLDRAGLGDLVVRVPLGVDTDHFSPPAGPASGPPIILCVGRVIPFKGIERTIRGLAEAIRVAPDARLRIVGPQPDPDHVAALIRAAEGAGVAHAVDLVGPVARQELVHEYRAARMMVIASRHEGFGMVVAEALACGTPVVALQASGGPSEIVDDGRTGRLVAEDDVGAAMISLLTDEAQRSSMARAARAAALAEYSTEATTVAFEQLIARAQGGDGRR